MITTPSKENIVVIGNSFILPSIDVDNPWPALLGLNVIGTQGASVDYHCGQIFSAIESGKQVIWCAGSHEYCDPAANGQFLLKYEWKENDFWTEHDKLTWFGTLTQDRWLRRFYIINVLALTGNFNDDDLMIVPLERTSPVFSEKTFKKPHIFTFPFGGLKSVSYFADGKGHINQDAHIVTAHIMALELQNRWKISFNLDGIPLLRSDLAKEYLEFAIKSYQHQKQKYNSMQNNG